MKQYHDYLRHILATGTRQANRTGVDAISTPGAMMQFDLQFGFPAVTTKKLFFGAVKGELLGFLRGYSNAAKFRELGCKIWDQNANENKAWLSNINRRGTDDLGRIYGVQWRDWRWEDRDGTNSIDQVVSAIETIKKDPTNRRIIINAWRPDEFDQMALPPCHVLYQFLVNVERKELNLCMYQRSADSFLGVPFNVASASLLLEIIAGITGYKPRHFTHFLADAHIYVDHLSQVEELLSRTPKALPKLGYIGSDLRDLYDTWGPDTFDHIQPEHFSLLNYEPHPPIEAAMAV